MPKESVLGNVITFLDQIGVYDVVLPFLLTFTIVFAIFEKTKVLGTEKVGGETYPKKNLNAIVAFVISFFVIASSRLVEAITSVSANMVILLLLAVFFLVLIGSFYKQGEVGEKGLEGWHQGFFVIFMLVGIVIIFLNAIKTKAGFTWLETIINFVLGSWSSTGSAAILLIIFIIGFMAWVTHSPSKTDKKKD